eukprot:gnl/Trimastix_PCT/1167.p1 GENE.gnl/Trimastix_PCT/1167~~gnl/Trimastix_PCT/1167.p1  ORF type:complete len:257 (+),score=33.00 gnl/Trimastix_PCT/1167:127-897(+)
MGNKQAALRKKQLEELEKRTHFDRNEINQLLDHFRSIARGGVIDKESFKAALGLRDDLFADRIFCCFDENLDGTIDVNEFLVGLSVLCSRGTFEEKLRFSFKVYDFDHDGNIDQSELEQILKAVLMTSDGTLTEEQITEAVGSMFSEADTDGNGMIDFDEYRTLVLKNPTIMSALRGGGAIVPSPGLLSVPALPPSTPIASPPFRSPDLSFGHAPDLSYGHATTASTTSGGPMRSPPMPRRHYSLSPGHLSQSPPP